MGLDVLIPTYCRSAALAVTLATLAFQTHDDFRVIVSDQSDAAEAINSGEVAASSRLLRLHGHDLQIVSHLPRRGLAEQRQFLLDQSTARYVGCGLIPSGVYHQELPTTVRDRRVDAPKVLPITE